jgi:sporulation protein YlmC with PRC-barrel domain
MVDRNNPDFLSASTIKKDKVVNRAGENLGEIEELMIDLQDGRVAYASNSRFEQKHMCKTVKFFNIS